ncbi:hypothetical protein AVEN_165301-1 [Araneus ventricosus]|uniref:Uncharacterized protein n=1 Tax=Araneus ventricosus TaxID=182803 RepID=A0A4Y2AW06_ARAVE|nr:hypothetical protein AVEN_165301-1 [Araneus ventricosus]
MCHWDFLQPHVGEVRWQFSAADRFYVGAGTCKLQPFYTINGMLADRSEKRSNESVCVARSLRRGMAHLIHSNHKSLTTRVARGLSDRGSELARPRATSIPVPKARSNAHRRRNL